MSGVDRLALVSKVLFDVRFVELKRENERLKLSLFWVDHSINSLKKAMCAANKHAAGPRCRCHLCMHMKRYQPTADDDFADEVHYAACKFGPWFEDMLQRHGLSFVEGRNTCLDFCRSAQHDREHYPKYDDNVHFHLKSFEDAGRQAWYDWVYGAKLWQAQTTEDAELAKLRALFETLRDEYSAHA